MLPLTTKSIGNVGTQKHALRARKPQTGEVFIEQINGRLEEETSAIEVRDLAIVYPASEAEGANLPIQQGLMTQRPLHPSLSSFSLSIYDGTRFCSKRRRATVAGSSIVGPEMHDCNFPSVHQSRWAAAPEKNHADYRPKTRRQRRASPEESRFAWCLADD